MSDATEPLPKPVTATIRLEYASGHVTEINARGLISVDVMDPESVRDDDLPDIGVNPLALPSESLLLVVRIRARGFEYITPGAGAWRAGLRRMTQYGRVTMPSCHMRC